MVRYWKHCLLVWTERQKRKETRKWSKPSTAHSHMYTDVSLPLQVLLRYCHTLPLLEPTTVDPQHSAYFAAVFPVRVVCVCDHWLTAINTPTGLIHWDWVPHSPVEHSKGLPPKRHLALACCWNYMVPSQMSRYSPQSALLLTRAHALYRAWGAIWDSVYDEAHWLLLHSQEDCYSMWAYQVIWKTLI